MVRQIIVAGFAVFLSTGAQAQGRGGMGSVSRGVAVAPRAMAQAPRAGTARPVPGARPVIRGGAVRPRTAAPGARGTRTQFATRRGSNGFNGEDRRFRPGCGSAPGLGFDAVHQAATCGSGGLGFGGRWFGDPFFFPMFDGGFAVPDSPAAVDDGSVAETQQPDAIDAEPRDTGRRDRAPQRAAVPAPATETASSAPADVEPFVFVRRDGTVFFAVAYTWEKGTLRYITSQGLRQTVTKDALDLDATRQFNEQRGLNIDLPA